MERVDVVVVGSRSRRMRAGGAVGACRAPGARAGQDELPVRPVSTHVLMPAGTSELAKLGALPQDSRPESVRVRYVQVEAEGITCRERVRPAADGIDYGVCVPRDLQDVELVESAREQGVDVRERCTVETLRWRAGRVGGVRYRALTEQSTKWRRRWSSARTVVARPWRRWSARGCPTGSREMAVASSSATSTIRCAGTVDAETYYQWRDGDSFAFAFPTTPAGRLLILLMGHRDEVSEARKDPEGYWLRKLREHPGLAPGSPELRRAPSCVRPAIRRPSSERHRGRGGRSRATPDISRIPSPARACATRCSPGARLPRRCCRCWMTRRPSTVRLAAGRLSVTASVCPPITLPTPILVPSGSRLRSASSCAMPGGRRARPQRPVRPRSHAQEIVPPPASRGPSSALMRGERPRAETVACALAELRTALADPRELKPIAFARLN